MTRRSGNIDDFGVATTTLTGPLQDRLAAIREAGFSQVLLDAADIARHPGGLEAASRAVVDSGLQVSGLQGLRDFEGLSGPQHAYKVEVAKAMLQMARSLGAPTLLVSSSTHPAATQPLAAIARDLRKLAMLAVPLGLRVAYEGVAGGRVMHDCLGAWTAVDRADMPNLGLAVDAVDTVLAGLPLEDLDLIEPYKIFLVRLADVFDADGPQARGPGAPVQRVFPGEGLRSEQIAALVRRLDELGFRGSYAFEVDNDDYRRLPAPWVAQPARVAALWLGEEVLRRSVPLPGQLRLKSRAWT